MKKRNMSDNVNIFKIFLVIVWFCFYLYRILFWNKKEEELEEIGYPRKVTTTKATSTPKTGAAITATTKTSKSTSKTTTTTLSIITRTVGYNATLSQQVITLEQGALVKEHKELFMTRQWKQILSWVSEHPEEVESFVDQQCHSVLHLACLFHAPQEVIESILQHTPKLAFVANSDEEYPLHWAMMLSMPRAILSLLLDTNPWSGIFARDKEGNSPLSFLWDRYKESLMGCHWEGGMEELSSHRGWNKIMDIFEVYHQACLVSSSSSSSASSSQIVALKTGTEQQQEQQIQQQQLLLQQNSHLTIKDEKEERLDDDIEQRSQGFRPLHIATQCPCPPELFYFLVRVYKETVREKDEHGRLPLFIVCQDPVANRCYDDTSKMEFLLQEYPNAAALAMPSFDNAGSRLPLHVAVESGVYWTEGIKQLFEAHPEALLIRDPVTGMFPFMLASTGCFPKKRVIHYSMKRSTGSAEKPTEKEVQPDEPSSETNELDTIYNLLRANPEVIQQN